MIKSKTEFIQKYSARKYGLVEYCREHERMGLNEKQIQAKLLVDDICKSSRSLYDNFSFYKNIKSKIGW